MLAFWGYTRDDWTSSNRSHDNQGLIHLGRLRPSSKQDMTVAVPFLPLWPGLVFNSALYASIWFSLFAGIASLRRARRRSRGHCAHCNYDLRGLNAGAHPRCPECGKPAPSPSPSTQTAPAPPA